MDGLCLLPYGVGLQGRARLRRPGVGLAGVSLAVRLVGPVTVPGDGFGYRLRGRFSQWARLGRRGARRFWRGLDLALFCSRRFRGWFDYDRFRAGRQHDSFDP